MLFAAQTVSLASPLHDSISDESMSFKKIKRLIARAKDVNELDENTKARPLHLAVRAGRMDVIKLLLKKKADINAKDEGKGAAPLHDAAASSEAMDILKYLVDKGADIEAKDEGGKTPLFVACDMGNLEAVKYLKEKGAKIEVYATGRFMGTPLHDAVNSGHLDVVEYLVGSGLGVDIKDKAGKTPLFIAAEMGRLKIVKYLVENGADVNAQNEDGTSIYQVVDRGMENAMGGGSPEGLGGMAMSGPDTDVPESDKIARSSIKQYLVSKGATLPPEEPERE